MRTSNAAEYLRSRLWIAPLIGVVVALALAIGSLALDQSVTLPFLSLLTNDADSARAVLTVVASAMVALTVFTFSVTMLVVQLASSQYSPHIVRTLMTDRATKATVTLFLSTFVVALVALRGVGRGTDRVPTISLALTYVLSWAALLAFVVYIDRVSRALRVATIIERLGRDADELIEIRAAASAREPPRWPPALDGETRVLGEARRSGVVSHIDEDGLVRAAARADLVIEVLRAVGDFVPRGAPLLRVYGPELDQHDRDRLVWLVSLKPERTLQQDLAYPIRQLVDIACRALSPSLNDPTTGVQAIDQLHDLLRHLVQTPDQPSALADPDGVARVLIPRHTWDDYLTLAITEIRLAGAGAPQVTRRLRAMLVDLLAVAGPDRQPAIQKQLELLACTVSRSGEPLPSDRKFGQGTDQQGIGPRVH